MGVMNLNNQPRACTVRKQNGELSSFFFSQYLYYLPNDFKSSDFNEYDLR